MQIFFADYGYYSLMKRAVKILLIILGAVMILLLALVVYYFAVTAGTKLDPHKLSLTENTVAIYDLHGDKIETPKTGESVRIAALPEYLPQAFVAVEDKRFYKHGGLDYKRMVKATVKNIASFSFLEGASTISQQLIKNTHLSSEKTINRKLREIKLTRSLEKKYSKDEILELYLNSIYFGHSAFGIENATQYYFGKNPSALTPAESAMLAALVKSPNRYSPFRDPEKCLSRRNFVLDLMQEQGILSQTETAAAKSEPLPATPAEEQKKSAYLDLVFEELSTLFPDTSWGDSLKVFTYFDPNLQSTLEKTEADSDVTVLVRDNRTHGVKALHSTCGILTRLPASTIKPLAVYAPAIEENLISPATPVLDEKVDFGGYSPSNFGGGFGGYMSVRYALSHSVNVPAVKILNELGVDKAESYLKKMELPIEEADKTLALALGGMKEGYTLSALADGYAVFANGGFYEKSGVISRIEDGKGKVLYERQGKILDRDTVHDRGRQVFSLDRRVFSEDTCALINDMLMTTVKEGTAKKLKSLPYQVCAKTGTGGTDSGNTDAYTVAYTTADTVAVWLGNRDNSPVQAMGGGAPANVALRVLQALYAENAPTDFASCENVVKAALDKEEYEQNHRLLLADPSAPDYLSFYELFRKSALPEGTSSKFSCPKIQKPHILVKNAAVQIILCQTEYYDYEVKRECDGQISVIYSGKYRKEITDNSVIPGKTYTYTVTPFYQGIKGESVQLPSVYINKSNDIPDDWWME